MLTLTHDAYARRGASLATVLAVIAAILVVMVLLAIPGVHRQRLQIRQHEITRTLMTIATAKEQYAMDHNLKVGDTVTLEQMIQDGKRLKAMPILPPDAVLAIGPIGTLPTCTLQGETISPLDTTPAKAASKS